MMAKNRQERYPDMAFLEVDLHRLEAGQTPLPVEPGLSAVETKATRSLPSSTTPPPAFDAALLARIEESLSQSIGPMARVIVRKVARTATSLDALCEELALQLAPGSERDAFCAKCLACGKVPAVATKPPTGPQPVSVAPGGRAPSPAGSSTPPGAATPAIAEVDLAALEAELAKQIGPLARVIVRKAAKGTSSLSALVSKLEENIPGQEGRRAFREALRKRAR